MHALPLLKKPLEQIGKQINVPGSYWEGRMSADERSTLYKCTVRDFTLAHKFPGKPAPESAFQLQEMGVSGTGSTGLIGRHLLDAVQPDLSRLFL